MDTSEEYRKYAQECLRWARQARDEAERQQFLEMASAWAQAASLKDGKLPITAPASPPRLPKH